MNPVNRFDCNVFESRFNGKFQTGYNFDEFDIKQDQIPKHAKSLSNEESMTHAASFMTRAID